MQDRYLFRAKQIDNGGWVIGCLIVDESRENEFRYRIQPIENGVLFALPVDPSTICQCTGRKDKIGNLVFENDIMCARLDDMYPDNVTYVQVVWELNGFYIKQNGCADLCPLEEIDMKYFEICGNIFDNSELLELEE